MSRMYSPPPRKNAGHLVPLLVGGALLFVLTLAVVLVFLYLFHEKAIPSPLALSGNPAEPESRGLPFTVAPDTTHITAPLRPNGSVDFLAAVNDRFGKDVTPDNNGLALFLQAIGTENDMLQPDVHDRVLAMLQISPTPPGTPVWTSYQQYLEPTVPGEQARADAYDILVRHGTELWTADSDPRIAAYLESQKRFLDQAVQASQRPRWWLPAYTPSGQLVSLMIPSLGKVRDMGNTLCARATLRARAGDIDGFLSDVAAVKHLGHHEAAANTLIDHLVGMALSTMADNTLSAVLATGTLNTLQCAKVKQTLSSFKPLPSIETALDMERWFTLDDICQVAMRSKLDKVEGNDLSALAAQLETSQIDWNAILRRVNQFYDQLQTLTRLQDMPEYQRQAQALDDDVDNRRKAVAAYLRTSGNAGLRKAAYESSDAYTQRIGDFLLGAFLASLARSGELHRSAVMIDDMTALTLAAAQYNAKNGAWPTRLDTLAPEFIPAVPQDIYTQAPLRYQVTEAGIRIYSLGRNLKDDAGIKDANAKKDDLVVGVAPGRAVRIIESLDDALANLKLQIRADDWPAALAYLAKVTPSDAQRPAVYTVLIPLLSNAAASENASAALAHWTTPESLSGLHARAVELLHPPMSEPSAQRLMSLAKLLVTLKDPQAGELYAGLLKSPSQRTKARDALLAMGPDAEPVIQAMLLHETEPAALKEALQILAKLGTEKSVPMIQAVLSSQDPEVSAAAGDALKALAARLALKPEQYLTNLIRRYVLDAPAAFQPDTSINLPNTLQWTHVASGRTVRSIYGIQVRYVGKEYKLEPLPNVPPLTAGTLTFQPLAAPPAPQFTQSLHYACLDGDLLIDILIVLDRSDTSSTAAVNAAIKRIHAKP